MSREEYMSELKEKLMIFDEDVVKEIIDDYEEHFKAGIANGKTEERICEELGNIDDFINELKEMYKTKDNNNKNVKYEFHFEDSDKNDNFNEKEFEKDLKSVFEGLSKSLSGFSKEISKRFSKVDINDIINDVGSAVKDVGAAVNDFVKDAKVNINFNNENGDYVEDVHGYSYNTVNDNSECFASSDAKDREVTVSANLGKYTVIVDNGGEQKAYKGDKGYEEGENQKEREEGEEDSISREGTRDGKTDSYGNETKNDNVNSNIPCTKAVIKSECANVRIERSEDSIFRVNYYNKSGFKDSMIYTFTGHQEGDTFYGNIVKNSGKNIRGFFNFMSSPDILIVLKVPDNMELIKINGSSGDVNVRDIKISSLDIEEKTGDIKVYDCSGKELVINSASGDISISDCVYEKINGITASGDIEISDIKAANIKMSSMSGDIDTTDVVGEKIKLMAKSGNVEVLDTTAAQLYTQSISGDLNISDFTLEMLTAESVSGNADIAGECIKTEIKTTSGDITAELEKGISEANVTSVSGSIDISLNNTDGYQADVSTKAGNVSLENDGVTETCDKGTFVFGNGEAKLTLSTISGDINVTSD